MTIRKAIDQIARRLPDVVLGIACKGTALESTTYNTNKKAFLFVGPKDARLKRAAGWTKFSLDAPPSQRDLAKWIAESHALMAAPPAKKPAPAKKKQPR
jgi:hypothetical protein